jgi:hypothetical protein
VTEPDQAPEPDPAVQPVKAAESGNAALPVKAPRADPLASAGSRLAHPVRVGASAPPGLGERVNGRIAARIRTDTMPFRRPSLRDLAAPGPALALDEPAAERAGGLRRLLSSPAWALALVLVVQAALSLRLIWSATAYIDEGLYLSVGHLELNHFLHGAAIPNVASFMSGSPVVYPPLAAIADNIGGLAGARLLSLAFMLVATAALYGVTRRLLDSTLAAFFAAALFGWLGTAQFLGAFATYDAMALMLLALATWLGVRAIEADDVLRYTLVCGAGVAMAVADAAKYAAALFNPVVLVVVALAAWRAYGRKAGLDSLGAMLLAAALPLTVGYDLAGSSYGQGISSTTLSRASSTASVQSVIDLSVHATGIIAVLAVLGALLVTVRWPGWLTVLLAWALVGAEFLAPAEQARIHTLTSLFKHVGYGAWFACVIAGYLLAELAVVLGRLGRGRWAMLAGTAAGTAVVLAAGAFGVTVANGQHGTWPNSRPMIADLSRLVRPTGIYLVEDPNVVTYYLRAKLPFVNVDDTYVFYYRDPQTHRMLVNTPAYAAAIQRGYFAGIVLAFGDTFATDQTIVADINRDHTYRLADVIPYRDSYGPSEYRIWVRMPPAPPKPVHPRRKHPARKHRRR